LAVELMLYHTKTQIIVRHDYNWENLVFTVGSGEAPIAQAIEERLQPAQEKIDELLHTADGFIQ